MFAAPGHAPAMYFPLVQEVEVLWQKPGPLDVEQAVDALGMRGLLEATAMIPVKAMKILDKDIIEDF